jgi:DNA-binding MarR family transcriptional regulator
MIIAMGKMYLRDKVPGLRHGGGETHLLLQLGRLHQSLVDVFPREAGVSLSRLGLFRVLALAGARGIGVLSVARRLGINAAAVTRQVQDLEREGLVTRGSDPRDQRRSIIKLSRNGRKQFTQLHRRIHELESRLLDGVTEQELAAASGMLAKVRASLEKMQ